MELSKFRNDYYDNINIQNEYVCTLFPSSIDSMYDWFCSREVEEHKVSFSFDYFSQGTDICPFCFFKNIIPKPVIGKSFNK